MGGSGCIIAALIAIAAMGAYCMYIFMSCRHDWDSEEDDLQFDNESNWED